MKPKLLNYVYLSAAEAQQLKEYIQQHPDKHIVIRMFSDSPISIKTTVGINNSDLPGWNPQDSDPINEEMLIDPEEYLYC